MNSTLSADGTRIAYESSGEGPALVLVHGTADDHTIWGPSLPELEQHFTVHALDRRGRGKSGTPVATTQPIEREADDIVAVIQAAGEPVDLLGHSYGALCALEAALRGITVRRLILYEPPIPIPPGSPVTPPGTLAKMEALLESDQRDAAVLTFAREIARLPEAEISAARSSPDWQATVAAAGTIVDEIRAVERYAFDPARFREVTTQTLLLCGSESPPFLRAATEAVAAALPSSRLTVLPGQGHLAMLTDPALFAREVVAFLTATAVAEGRRVSA